MISVRRMSRRLAAALTAISLGCGLALAAGAAAQAAVPNQWGFALVEKPSGPVVTGHWAQSVVSPTPTATPGTPGQEVVRFPKIGFSKAGVVHVTAVTDQLAWCQAQRWRPLGGAELVTVQCYRKGGIPQFVPFTVMFTQSTGTLPGGLRYAYVLHTAGGTTTSFNSTSPAPGANTVTPGATGVWLVRMHGAGPAAPSGGVQVTAVNPLKPAICDIGGRTQTPSQQIIQVRCYDAVGKPMASGWTLSYQRGRAITGAMPKAFAYTVRNKPSCPLVPAPPAVNFNSAGGINGIVCSGLGEWLVNLPRVGVLPNTVFVTAAAPVARVCNLNTVWATSGGNVIVRDVVCYQPSGPAAPTNFFLTYTSKL
jgi:hypothetical protein